MKGRTLGLALIAVGLVGLTGITWRFAASDHAVRGPTSWSGVREGSACILPALPGQTVDVVLSDMGGGMMGGRMLSVAASPSSVSAGDVSFRVWNQGAMVHEFVVLPLETETVGQRPVGADGRVSETGSLGEASNTCAAGAGDGIPPGSASWVTLHLDPGRYELICNLPGHYARGMFVEFDVQ